MKHSSLTRGYSLLELIVSLGIFSMVMLVVLGAYVTLISLDRQARANNQLASSLSFGIESMARSMRTGTEYSCNATTIPSNCTSNPGSSISFCLEGRTCRDGDADVQYLVTYFLKNDGSIGQCTGSLCTETTSVPLTDPRIDITTLRFYVRGVGVSGADANIQPSVTFLVSGTMVTDAGETSDFSIQTGATQRQIEL